MKELFLIDSTKLQCNKGSSTSTLKVTSQNFNFIDGKLQATENDIKPNENILPFGICSVTQKSCVPSPTNWQDKVAWSTINNMASITNKSKLPCSIGGIIKCVEEEQNFSGIDFTPKEDAKQKQTYFSKEYTENSEDDNPPGNVPRLVITTDITNYTCQFIYGDYEHDLDYESIVVPTYKMNLEMNGEILNSYNVTRDGWYSRGYKESFLWYDDIELTNRHFEPADANINLFSTVPMDYYGLDAFALRQKGSPKLKASAFTTKMNTRIDGNPIDHARDDLSIAKDVMIHVGGWYYNKDKDIEKLAGSYGCFGFIPNHQLGSKEKMEKWRKNKAYEDVETSNKEYEKFLNDVIEVRGNGALHVLIKKRTDVEKHKILKDQ